jgi:hypothetical protein
MQKRHPRRITRKLTRQESKRLKASREQIARELPELIQMDQRRKEASEEATLSGELRRAVHASGSSLSKIAASVGITPLLLDDFLIGERTLRSDVMDRLAGVLGYELSRNPS